FHYIWRNGYHVLIENIDLNIITMKKNSIYISIDFIAFFTLTSCKDFLELDPKSTWKDETFYSTKEEAALALSGIYHQLASESLYGYKFNVTLEAGTDESYTNDPSENWNAAKYAYTSGSNEIEGVWLKFYSCIQLV